jgi:hypothetical protein
MDNTSVTTGGAINQSTSANQQNIFSTQTNTGVNMQNIVSNVIPNQPQTVAVQLTTLNSQLKNCADQEVAAMQTVHQQLYIVLGLIHNVCLYLLNPANKAEADQFKQYVKDQTGKVCTDDKIVAAALKLVFADIDAKKAYTYRTVIGFAIAEKVAAGGFVLFVTQTHSGIENARKAKYAADRLKQGVSQQQTRRLQTQTYVAQQPLSVVPEAALQAALPNTAIGQQFVLVASRLDNGLIAFNAASIDDAALAAALRSVFKDSKEAIKAMPVPPTSLQQAVTGSYELPSAVQTMLTHTYRDTGGNTITRPIDPVQAAIDAVENAVA